MKTLYLECSAGASGDMMMSALSGLLDDIDPFVKRMNSLGIPGVEVRREKTEKLGIACNHIAVEICGGEEDDIEHCHHHSHITTKSVSEIIDSLDVSDKVREDAKGIYSLIAEAESNAHGVPVDKVHFHEVGMLDAVTDIVGVCLLFEMLAPEHVYASPVRTGYGHVTCMHGTIPIPAPATEYILRGIPCYAGDVEGEFCTPTGAAVLKHFVDEFTGMPFMTYSKVGYGAGKKDYPIANMIRAFLGESSHGLPRVCEIVCNVDDMFPEDIAETMQVLLDEGALDAFITPIIMKRGRPASMITCLCRPTDTDRFSRLMLAHTSSSGLRVTLKDRYEMVSHFEERQIGGHTVKVKVSEGFGIRKEKPEFSDLKEISDKTGIPVRELRSR